MTVARGSQGSFGYSQSQLLGVHRDQTKLIALKEPPTFTTDIAEIEARVFTSGAYHQSIEYLQGMYSCTGTLVYALHPSEGIELFKGALSSVTSTELTGAGTGIYEHEFVNENTIPMTKGFSFTIDMDLKTMYISGAIVTSIEMGAEVNGEVMVTVNWLAKKWEQVATGSSGTSQGQNAMSFTVTIVASTSDDFKLAIDGGTAVECTIAAGAYTTAATLEAAINTAILAQTDLQDSDGEPEVACYIDTDNKINFYTADKGTGAEVAWTAGSNDAGTLLGYGTPVEAAGTAALPSLSYSTVQPFVSTQLNVLQDTVELCVESCTVTIEPNIEAKNCLGSKFMKAPKLVGKPNVTIAFTKDYEDETQVTPWSAETDVTFELNFRTGTAIVAASGVDYDADLYLKKTRIRNSPTPAFNGAGALTQEVTAVSVYEDATYRNIKFDINNAMSTMRG